MQQTPAEQGGSYELSIWSSSHHFSPWHPAWRGGELSWVASRKPGCATGLWRLMWREQSQRTLIISSLPWSLLCCCSMPGEHKAGGYPASHPKHQLTIFPGRTFGFLPVKKG